MKCQEFQACNSSVLRSIPGEDEIKECQVWVRTSSAFRRAERTRFDSGFSRRNSTGYCEGGVLGCAGAGVAVVGLGGRGIFFFAAGFLGSLSSTTIFFGGGGGAACSALI
jgi:hypothetical protein